MGQITRSLRLMAWSAKINSEGKWILSWGLPQSPCSPNFLRKSESNWPWNICTYVKLYQAMCLRGWPCWDCFALTVFCLWRLNFCLTPQDGILPHKTNSRSVSRATEERCFILSATLCGSLSLCLKLSMFEILNLWNSQHLELLTTEVWLIGVEQSKAWIECQPMLQFALLVEWLRGY